MTTIAGYRIKTKNTTYLLYRMDDSFKILAVSEPRTSLSLSNSFQLPVTVRVIDYPPYVDGVLRFGGCGPDWPLKVEDGDITTTLIDEVVPLTLEQLNTAVFEHFQKRNVTHDL